MGLMEFLSLPGQERTRRRDEFLGGLLNYYLGPTGIPERLGLVDMMNPVSDVGRAMTSSQEMLAPGRTPMERIGAGATMLTDIASVAAPSVATRIAGGDAAQAVTEGLLGMGGQTARGLDDAARRFAMDEDGALTLGRSDPAADRGAGLPVPRNEAEAMARQVLEMRAAGRAGDVTEEMRAAADPLYMFENTPLPMDEASRMARADQMFPDTGYHATTSDFQAFDPLMRGTATDAGWFGNADYFSPSSQYAERFVSFPAENPLVIPARLNRGNVYDWRAMEADRGGRGLGNNADAALQTRERLEREGFNSVEVSNPVIKADAPLSDELWSSMIRADPSIEMMGRENVSKSLQAGIPRKSLEDYYSAEMLDLLPTQRVIDEIAIFSPNQIRSRFALFDPEFRHLRNLSAGVGGLGLLATQTPEQRDEEIRQYLGGLL